MKKYILLAVIIFSIAHTAVAEIIPSPVPKPYYTTTGLYRLYSQKVGEHFYTTDYKEAFSLNASGLYRLEGVEGHVYIQQFIDSVPLYRFYNKQQNRHFYSTSAAELNQVIKQGFILEGVIGYMNFSTGNPNGMNPHNFHRLYNPSTNDHFYTSNDEEMLALEREGMYLREGDMGYIYK
jgi:hypothetical protein